MAKKKASKKTRPSRDKLPRRLQGVKTAKIIQFRIEKIKRCKLVNLVWDEKNALVVEGKNSQGKTTTVESFAMLLAGGAMPDNAIHRGESEGSIVARLETEVGVLVVEKAFTEDKDPALSITIEGQRGQLKPEQTILDILIDTIATKPREFFDLEDKAQAEMLARIKGFDPTELNKKRELVFEERRVAKGDAKRLEAVYEAIPHHKDAPGKKVSAAEMLAELEEITTHNATGADLERGLDTATADLAAARDELTQAKMDLLEAQESVDALVASQAAAIAADDDFEPKDDSELREKIKKADEINAAVSDNDNKAKARSEYLAAQKISDDLSDQIDEIDREKKAALVEAGKDLPVEGLELTEDCVMLNGAPLSEAGKGERMLIATAVMMGVNKESPLKVVLIDDAESMDEDTCRKQTEMIDAAGFQSLATRVLHRSGATEGAMLIEDGQVQA